MIRLICAGARLSEVVQVRVSDLDAEHRTIDLRDARGRVWRKSAVPASLKYELYHETYGKAPDDFLFAVRQESGRWQPISPRGSW
jgi:integrase